MKIRHMMSLNVQREKQILKILISNSTQKELRKAHNLEKMYRAGSFNE